MRSFSRAPFLAVIMLLIAALEGCSTLSRSSALPPAPHASAAAVRGIHPKTAGTLHATAASAAAVPATPPTFTGVIEDVVQGTIKVNADEGYWQCVGRNTVVMDASTTVRSHGLPLAIGKYAQVWTADSCATGTELATTVSVWDKLTLSGVISATTPDVVEINSPTCGYIAAAIDDDTAWSLNGLNLAPGTLATINGLGTCTTRMGKTYSVTLGPPLTPGLPSPPPAVFPPSIAQRHVLTADFLGGAVGTRAISWAQAATYLDWAETQGADLNPVWQAGIRTLFYTNPNRTAPGDPLYTNDESTFAHACAGTRLSMPYSGSIQYLMDPSSPALLSLWQQQVNTEAQVGHIDAVFVDQTNDLWGMNLPCNYRAFAWMDATTTMLSRISYPVVFSNLDGTNSNNMARAPNAIGGMMEDCFGTNQQPTPPYTSGSVWTTHIDRQLEMARLHRLFVCHNNPTGPASSSIPLRQYIFASFLLAFDPGSSVLWEYFDTPSSFHVMPESALVPTYPTIAAPIYASGLQVAPGVYAREYQACYLAGSLIGPCAAVVNTDSAATVPFPLTGYRTTLDLSGAGVVDGGTALPTGPLPASLPPFGGVVAFK